MMRTSDTDEIETSGDMIDGHRAEAMALAERAEALAHAIEQVPVNSELYRRLNQRLGVALKLATVHAHLALAVAGPSVYVSEVN